MSSHSRTDAALREIYDEIPPMANCKGLCWISCGPISMSQRERQRLRAAGFRITDYGEAVNHAGEYWCEALGPDGRCQAYELRPLICRLWGTVPGLRCPHGCVPEGGFLTDADGRELILDSLRAGGDGQARAGVAEVLRRRALPRGRDDTAIRQRGLAGDRAAAIRHGDQLPDEVRRRRPQKARPGTS